MPKYELLPQFDGRHVVSVPEAGKVLGLGRTASYMAANAGELPVLRFRGKLVVPVVQLEALLSGQWSPGKQDQSPAVESEGA